MFLGIKQYLPSLGMLLATLLSAFYIALGDNVVSASEWFMVTAQGLGGITVYIVPRLATVTWLKPAVAAATLGVSAAGAAFITDGINAQEWIVIAIQALAGLGIVLSSNGEVPMTLEADTNRVRRQASG